jgi:hypothetical protein
MAGENYLASKSTFYGTPYEVRDKLSRLDSGENPDGTPYTPHLLTQTDNSVTVVAGLASAVNSTNAAANGTLIKNAVQAAAGKRVVVPPGDWPCKVSFTTEEIDLEIRGRLLQVPDGTTSSGALNVFRVLGSPQNVSAINYAFQMGPNGPSFTAAQQTEIVSTITVPDVTGIARGDVFRLDAFDAYAFDVSDNSGTHKTYRAEFCEVNAVGVQFTPGGTATIYGGGGNASSSQGVASTAQGGSVIVGQTSGATGQVIAVITLVSGDKVALISTGVTGGTFQNGETLTVGGVSAGTVSAAPFLVLNKRLCDTGYNTSVKLRSVPKTPCRITGRLGGDPSQLPDKDYDLNRSTIMALAHLVDAEIDVTVENFYTTAINPKSCFRGRIVARLRNGANWHEDNGFGYGVNLQGCTEAMQIRLYASNVRHPFTTTPSTFTTGTTLSTVESSIYNVGLQKYNVVSDSVAYGNLAAGFDTHEACYFTTFRNCRAIGGYGGARTYSLSAGFQDRGFGTTYDGCEAHDVHVAFQGSHDLLIDSEFDHKVRYMNCRAVNCRRAGFAALAIPAHMEYEASNCTATLDPTITSTQWSNYGFYFPSVASGRQVNLRHCYVRNPNHSAYRWNSGTDTGRFTMQNCVADFVGNQQQTTCAVGVDHNADEINVTGLVVRLDSTNPTYVASAFRSITSTVNQTIRCGEITWENASPRPVITTTGSAVLAVTAPRRTGVGGRDRKSLATSATIGTYDHDVVVTDTSASRTVTLPDAKLVVIGAPYRISDGSGGARAKPIKILPVSSQTIDGATLAYIWDDYGWIEYVSDGTNWHVVNSTSPRPTNPLDQGLVAWSLEPSFATTSATSGLTSGTLYVSWMRALKSAQIANLWLALTKGDTTTWTSGQNFLGLYDKDGNLIGSTADLSATLATRTGTLAAVTDTRYALQANAEAFRGLMYGVGWLFNWTGTHPTMSRGGSNAFTIHMGQTTSPYRWSSYSSGLTALPSTITPSSGNIHGASWLVGMGT